MTSNSWALITHASTITTTPAKFILAWNHATLLQIIKSEAEPPADPTDADSTELADYTDIFLCALYSLEQDTGAILREPTFDIVSACGLYWDEHHILRETQTSNTQVVDSTAQVVRVCLQDLDRRSISWIEVHSTYGTLYEHWKQSFVSKGGRESLVAHYKNLVRTSAHTTAIARNIHTEQQPDASAIEDERMTEYDEYNDEGLKDFPPTTQDSPPSTPGAKEEEVDTYESYVPATKKGTAIRADERGLFYVHKIGGGTRLQKIECSCAHADCVDHLVAIEFALDATKKQDKIGLYIFMNHLFGASKGEQPALAKACAHHLYMVTDLLHIRTKDLHHYASTKEVQHQLSSAIVIRFHEIRKRYHHSLPSNEWVRQRSVRPLDALIDINLPKAEKGSETQQLQEEWLAYQSACIRGHYGDIWQHPQLQKDLQVERDLIAYHFRLNKRGLNLAPLALTASSQLVQQDTSLFRKLITTTNEGTIPKVAIPLGPFIFTGSELCYISADIEAVTTSGAGRDTIDAYTFAPHPDNLEELITVETYATSRAFPLALEYMRAQLDEVATDRAAGHFAAAEDLVNNHPLATAAHLSMNCNSELEDFDPAHIIQPRQIRVSPGDVLFIRSSNVLRITRKDGKVVSDRLREEPVILYRTRYITIRANGEIDQLAKDFQSPVSRKYALGRELLVRVRAQWDGSDHREYTALLQNIPTPMETADPVARMISGTLSFYSASVAWGLQELLLPTDEAFQNGKLRKSAREALLKAFSTTLARQSVRDVHFYGAHSTTLQSAMGFSRQMMFEYRKQEAWSETFPARDVPNMYNKSCYANGNHLVTLDRKYLLRACPKAVEHLTKWKEEREVREREEAEKEKQAELERKRLAEANEASRTGALRNEWTSWTANSRRESRKKNAEN